MSLCHLTHDSQQNLSAQQGKAIPRLHVVPQDRPLTRQITRQNTPKHLTQLKTVLNKK